MSDVFRAVEAFAFTSKSGVPRVITPGALISSDDPDYKGREHLFEPVALAANRAMETASAGPGERRVRTRPGPEAPAHRAGHAGDKPKEGD